MTEYVCMCRVFVPLYLGLWIETCWFQQEQNATNEMGVLPIGNVNWPIRDLDWPNNTECEEFTWKTWNPWLWILFKVLHKEKKCSRWCYSKKKQFQWQNMYICMFFIYYKLHFQISPHYIHLIIKGELFIHYIKHSLVGVLVKYFPKILLK